MKMKTVATWQVCMVSDAPFELGKEFTTWRGELPKNRKTERLQKQKRSPQKNVMQMIDEKSLFHCNFGRNHRDCWFGHKEEVDWKWWDHATHPRGFSACSIRTLFQNVFLLVIVKHQRRAWKSHDDNDPQPKTCLRTARLLEHAHLESHKVWWCRAWKNGWPF